MTIDLFNKRKDSTKEVYFIAFIAYFSVEVFFFKKSSWILLFKTL